MKSLVVGFGSAGTRHARVLQAMGHKVAAVSARETAALPRYTDLDAALSDFAPDYVAIANATAAHGPALETLAKAGFDGAVIVEKPLFATGAPLPDHRFRAAAVAYQLRCHPVVEALRGWTEGRRIVSAHAYAGQYLPDWRPGRDYRATASAGKDHGGGVLRDLSHELDLMAMLFGGWTNLTAAGGRFGDLEIDADDVFALTYETDRCPLATVQLNYHDRTVRRSIVVQATDGTAVADLAAGTFSTNGEPVRFEFEMDDIVADMHGRLLERDGVGLCSLEEGLAVCHMIDAAEAAARDRVWIAA